MVKVSDSLCVCPSLFAFSVVWCADTGMSYSHKVDISLNLETLTSEFICNQTKRTLNQSQLQLQLSQTLSYYYSFQLGGSSDSFLLIKISPYLADNDDYNICWNALNFLHQVGWIEYTNPEHNISKYHALGVAQVVNATIVNWVPSPIRIAKINAIPAIDIHWVWFRRSNYKLTQEIIERAYSWIALNPGCRFHLWTDILSATDFDDFMSLVESEWRINFVNNVNVHLHDETYGLIENALTHIESSSTSLEALALALASPSNQAKLPSSSAIGDGIKLLRNEFYSIEKQSRIYKTDFVRLLILGTLGGVYVDFNDCICIAPIRDVIALYGYDTPLGVSDLYDVNHASNYFLYCPPPNVEDTTGNAHWNDIVVDMIAHVPHIVALIRNMELCDKVREYVKRAIHSLSSDTMGMMNITELQKLYEQRILPYCGNENIGVNTWNRFIWVLVGDIALKVGGNELRVKIQPRIEYAKRAQSQSQSQSQQRRLHSSRVKPSVIDNSIIDSLLAYIADDSVYKELFLFWWTDYNLRVLMHYTNLPIFCRMRKIPLTLLPFGFLLTNCCALSWIGHIGDGTSYGMDGRKDSIRIRNFFKD